MGGTPEHLSEALVCPPSRRLPKTKSCKENALDFIGDRSLGWPQPWLRSGLAWALLGAKLDRRVGQLYDLLSYSNPYIKEQIVELESRSKLILLGGQASPDLGHG